jgi:hypothetical protein
MTGSSIKSETMRRMDAMAAAGLQPDLLVTSDTVTIRNNRTVTIMNPRWSQLINENLIVRAAYDNDGELPGDEPTITTLPAPAAEPLVTSWKREPEHEPEPQSAPAHDILITAARDMAKQFTNRKDVPEHDHVAWLLDALADALEKAEVIDLKE